MLIKEMPREDKPREKFKKYGSKYLSNSELLAIIIRVGKKGKNVLDISKEVMNNLDSINELTSITYEELMKFDGIGEVKAIEILSAVELGFRIYKKTTSKIIKINKPELVYDYIKEYTLGLKQEHFYIILLNTKSEIIKHKLLFIGSLNQAIVHPREIFKEATKSSAASIILIHNHPSGDTTPSGEDIKVTKRICEIGKIMDINILDHIIVSDEKYLSLKSEGFF